MASSVGFDHHYNDYCSQPRGFLTPPPTWKTNRHSPAMTRSEMKPRRTPEPKADRFHVIHKIPSGDSPYVRAKHVQLVDRDPSRAISLFWAAINSGDRVDSALKDMAVVMKQLDRSDEAIEAIKSFRHLSPLESQESLDNILVELYKQSGRMEEEIEMLQRKLKQLEGIAFSGKRTKIARSQGKKVQITVEKEYSRLLGNLAWAYMQQKDFKSAEEYYRKALSIEPDKNKQCNLAVCLVHMNKLTEAKFLLQTVRFSSGNDYVDESYVKSYERASQILAEFESQKETEHNNEQVNKMKSFGGGQWDSRFCSQKKSDDNNVIQSSPLPLSVKTNNGAFTEFPYEKRADFDWRRNHCQPHIDQEEAYSAQKRAYEFPHCYGNIPKVPCTQPKRCLQSGDQRNGGLKENATGSYCRKLSFGSSSTGSEHSSANQNVNYYSEKQFSSIGGDWRRISSVKSLEGNVEETNSLAYDRHNSATVEERALPSDAKDEKNLNLQAVCGKPCKISACEHRRSWADMVEEDEHGFGRWEKDENEDSNIYHETPKSHDQTEKLSHKMEFIDLGSGYLTQPEKNALSVRRSLCFDQNHNPNTPKNHYTSPLTTKVLNFEGQAGGLSEDHLSSSSNRRRLKVFQDITSAPGSPTT